MNMAYRFRIYPTREQENLLAKTFGSCRFLYNQMLSDKIREYEVSKKMLRNTPAMYKKEYPFLKEVDALALANVHLHLEKAYKNFFRDPKSGFPKFKSKHTSRKSYTTNRVNGNIQVEDYRIKLPKLTWIRMKKHRDIPEKYRLKSVTVSMEPSEKYYASLLYEISDCENQTGGVDYEDAKILGIDYAMRGMAVFSENIKKKMLVISEKARSGLQGNSGSYPIVRKEAGIISGRKNGLHYAMKRSETRGGISCIN